MGINDVLYEYKMTNNIKCPYLSGIHDTARLLLPRTTTAYPAIQIMES